MLYRYLPYPVFARLFGDRRTFGLVAEKNDPDYLAFHANIWDFYANTQQKGIGNAVSSLEYTIIKNLDFTDKTVLEIGPGIIRHLHYMNQRPRAYHICDISGELLDRARRQLVENGIPAEPVLLDQKRGSMALPYPDRRFDIVISFNTLEHVSPLDDHIREIHRVLKPGGILAGGIPCEGGIAWGLGRFLTTRRFVRKKYGIDYDKIICWEHPNFTDQIINGLDSFFKRIRLVHRPFYLPSIDMNLVVSFICSKEE